MHKSHCQLSCFQSMFMEGPCAILCNYHHFSQVLSHVNQGKLAGAIAQSGTMLAYQMERLPPRRVQVEPYAREKCKQLVQKSIFNQHGLKNCTQATAREVSSKLGCGGQLTKATLSCLQVGFSHYLFSTIVINRTHVDIV